MFYEFENNAVQSRMSDQEMVVFNKEDHNMVYRPELALWSNFSTSCKDCGIGEHGETEEYVFSNHDENSDVCFCFRCSGW
jgi:hypothetical protein